MCIRDRFETVQKSGLEGEYIVDSKAKKILQEADAFLAAGDEGLLEDAYRKDDLVNFPADRQIEYKGEVVDEVFVKHISNDVDVQDDVKEKSVINENQKLAVINKGEEGNKTESLLAAKNKKLITIREVKPSISKQNNVVVRQEIRQNNLTVKSKKVIKNQGEVVADDSAFTSKQSFAYHIQQLKKFYEIGDSERTADLYISSGRENDIRGADKLRKYYRKAFAKTSNRKFEYVINSIKQDKESAVVIEGKVNLSFSSKKLLRKVDRKIDATFVILLLKVGKEFKIASFDWKEV